MTANIERIDLWQESDRCSIDGLPPAVRIVFKFPCGWTVLNIEELKQILRLWIKGEEMKYPCETYRGRWLLFDEIEKIFKEV